MEWISLNISFGTHRILRCRQIQIANRGYFIYPARSITSNHNCVCQVLIVFKLGCVLSDGWVIWESQNEYLNPLLHRIKDRMTSLRCSMTCICKFWYLILDMHSFVFGFSALCRVEPLISKDFRFYDSMNNMGFWHRQAHQPVHYHKFKSGQEPR